MIKKEVNAMQQMESDKVEMNEDIALHANEVHDTLQQMMQELVLQDVRKALDENLKKSSDETKKLFEGTNSKINQQLRPMKGLQATQTNNLQSLSSSTQVLAEHQEKVTEKIGNIYNALVAVLGESKKQPEFQETVQKSLKTLLGYKVDLDNLAKSIAQIIETEVAQTEEQKKAYAILETLAKNGEAYSKQLQAVFEQLTKDNQSQIVQSEQLNTVFEGLSKEITDYKTELDNFAKNIAQIIKTEGEQTEEQKKAYAMLETLAKNGEGYSAQLQTVFEQLTKDNQSQIAQTERLNQIYEALSESNKLQTAEETKMEVMLTEFSQQSKQQTTQILEQDIPELKRQFVFQQKMLYASLTLQGITVLGVLAGVFCYLF